MHPAVADGGRGGLGVAPVAPQLGGRAEADLADLAGVDRPVVLVADLELDAGPGPTDGEAAPRRRRRRTRWRCRRRPTRSTSSGSSRPRRCAPAPRAPGPAATARRPSRWSSRADRSWSSKSGCAQQQRELRGDAADAGHAARRRSSAARRRPASGRCRCSGHGPRRRYHGSLVMKPMWASWVPDSMAPPAVPGSAHAPPVSIGGDRGQLALAEHGALGHAGRARGEHDRRPGARGRRAARAALRPRARLGGRRAARRRRSAISTTLAPARRRARPRPASALASTSAGRATSSTAARSAARRPRVDPGADGAELGQRGVGDDVVGGRRQGQRHQVALADAEVGQTRRRPRRSAGRARRSVSGQPLGRRRTRAGRRTGWPPRGRSRPAPSPGQALRARDARPGRGTRAMRVMRPSATVATMHAGMATVDAVGGGAAQDVLLQEAAGDHLAALSRRSGGRRACEQSHPSTRSERVEVLLAVVEVGPHDDVRVVARRGGRRGRRPRSPGTCDRPGARVSSSVMASSSGNLMGRQERSRHRRRSADAVEPRKGTSHHGTDGVRRARRGARRRSAGSSGTSDWLEITQERVDQFADATGDHQWIHVDPERAEAGPFGGPIAHGYLTLSLSNALLPEIVEVRGISMGVNYGVGKVRFPAPVLVGSRIRASADARPRSRR